MADVRSLLRQQRAQRRIDHPHAAYSDAGKLVCTACREPIKADGLWDQHVRNPHHLQAAKALAARAKQPPSQHHHKRKLDDAEEHEDGGEDESGHDEERDGDVARSKRSRQDVDVSRDLHSHRPETSPATVTATRDDRRSSGGKENISIPGVATATTTPQRSPSTITPPLTRRASGTPSQGVELQIPSRPATPNMQMPSNGRSPLIPQDASSFTSTSTTSVPRARASSSTTAKPPQPPLAGEDDEDWAAFEAEVVNAKPALGDRNGIAPASASSGAVISAAPVSAAELAARTEEDDRQRRRLEADIQIEDEREEAARALEAEFDEMEALEARVRRLKERREALRAGSLPPPTAGGRKDAGVHADVSEVNGASASPAPPALTKVPDGKENAPMGDGERDGDEEGGDEDEEDEDDWVGFRFRR